MPNPRNRHSRMRKRSRRTHDKALMPTLSFDKTTGETHLRHRAYKHEGSLYYKGQMVVKAKEVVEASDAE